MKDAKYFEVCKYKENRLKVESIMTTAGGNIKKPHKNNYTIVIDTETSDKKAEKAYCINLNEKQFFHFLADLVDLYECMHNKKLKLKDVHKYSEKQHKKTEKRYKKLKKSGA